MPDDVCDRAIHAALRRIESERSWTWLENITSSLVADTQGSDIAVPAQCGAIWSLAYLSGTTGYDRLKNAPLPNVRELQQGAFVGYPSAYNFSNGRVYLDCAVPEGATFELIWKSRTPRNVADAVTDPPITLSLERNAVIAYACYDVALSFLKNEAEAARQNARFQQLLQTMMDEEDEARADSTGGCVVPDQSYHVAAYGFGVV